MASRNGSNRRIHIRDIETTTPGKFLAVDVAYRDGNGFSGGGPRCYCVSVGLITVEKGFTKYHLYAGTAKLLETAARFSAKRLDELAAMIRTNPDGEPLKGMVDLVCRKNGLSVAGPSAQVEEPCLAEAVA